MKNILISAIILITVLGSCTKKGETPVPTNSTPVNNGSPYPTYVGNKVFVTNENTSISVNLKDSIQLQTINYWTIQSYTIKHGVIDTSGTTVKYTPNTNFVGVDTLNMVIKSSSGYTLDLMIKISVVAVPVTPHFTVVYNGVTYTYDFITGGGFGKNFITTNVDTFNYMAVYFFDMSTGGLFQNGIPLATAQSWVGNKYLINSGTGTNPTLITSNYSFSLVFDNTNNGTSTTTVRYPDTSQYYVQITSFDTTTNIIEGNFVCQLTNGVTITGNFAQIVPIL